MEHSSLLHLVLLLAILVILRANQVNAEKFPSDKGARPTVHPSTYDPWYSTTRPWYSTTWDPYTTKPWYSTTRSPWIQPQDPGVQPPETPGIQPPETLGIQPPEAPGIQPLDPGITPPTIRTLPLPTLARAALKAGSTL